MNDDEVRARYAAGESLRTLAESYGVAVSTVAARLPERRRQGRGERADVSTAEIVRLHDEDGLSLSQIAAQYGMHKSTVSRRYRAATA